MSIKKVEILTSVFGSPTRQGKELLFYCKRCDFKKKKLSFNIDRDVFKCWYCDWSGKSIYGAIRKYGSREDIASWIEVGGNIDFSTYSDEFEKEDEPRLSLPEEFRTLTKGRPSPSGIKAKRYLSDRGLTLSDVIRWKMGYCSEGKYKDRVVIPSFNLDGDLDYFIARSFVKWRVNYLNPSNSKDIIFNEMFLDWSKDIVIVEGVFDAIVAGNSVPLLGSTLIEASDVFVKIVSNCKKVYLALDSDAKEKEQRITDLLLSYDVEVFKIKVHPYNDVGEMTKQEFQDRKKSAVKINKENDIEYIVSTFYE